MINIFSAASSNEAELERMSVENKVLRDMLSQVSDKYSNLQTQMISLMQHQKDNHHHHGKVDEEDNRNNWEGGVGSFPRNSWIMAWQPRDPTMAPSMKLTCHRPLRGRAGAKTVERGLQDFQLEGREPQKWVVFLLGS